MHDAGLRSAEKRGRKRLGEPLVVLDAGFFVALARRTQFAGEMLKRAKDRKTLTVAASTISEFWRQHRGLGESRFGLLRPVVFGVDEALAKRAGELLGATRGKNAMDAIVVALAERLRADEIYTSDATDIEKLLSVSTHLGCEVIGV